MVKLVLVLGDQLDHDLSALREAGPDDVVVMAEVSDEATYVRHHVKKLAFTFSAMRHFAEELRAAGRTVAYSRLDDPDTGDSICAELLRRAKEHGADEVLTTECGEWRLRDALRNCPVKTTLLPDDRFLCSAPEFARWAKGRKQLRMEYFYREMRQRTGLLMEDGAPAGGQWNYDQDNRKFSADLSPPERHWTEPDAITSDVLDMVEARFANGTGQLRPFRWAVDRDGALAAAKHFMAEALPSFGDYQDAMLEDRPFLYHSLLGLYLNAGLLRPLELCEMAEAEWRSGRAPLNAVEGYIRQIIGWREYIRGIYDLEGPDYVRRNHFGHDRTLPDFYWTGETDMACLKAAIGATLEHAYAHHIQRLMVTGNFALLLGVDPHEVHEWYLAVYADAYEWVEAPNVIGMALFADGGVLASKPYSASGAYINKMSDHCKGCAYKVSKKTEDDACPFNALYWDFMVRNRDKLASNPRIGRIYGTWDKMAADKQHAYRARARKTIETLT